MLLLSRLVCYLVNKRWLTDAVKLAPGMKSPKRLNKTPSNFSAKPGCSHWEDGKHSLGYANQDYCIIFLQGNLPVYKIMLFGVF